ncbi:hypothetical protein LCGC14_1315900 [marine sediment metagenome]|uniref:Uncharacterized protein n=1 Tax=marine sediment metagenome TaxID=412755 RepID=A0A0F9NND3_9ZZZZ
MPERWSPEELNKYKEVIKAAPKSRARAETKRKRKLNKLFNKLHRQDISINGKGETK